MPETIQAYLEAVEEQIRWKRARLVVSLELRRHLEDQRDAFAAEGVENPERLAVEEMGDPVAVGTELDRLHRPRPQWGLLQLTLFLASIGAYLRLYFTRGDGEFALSPVTTCLALVLGSAVMLGIYFLDVTFLARHPRMVYLGALAAGVLSLWISPYNNNSHYYTCCLISIYPAVYAVWLYGCRGSAWRHFALAVTGGIPPAVICMLTPSTFGLFLLLFVGLILLLCAIRMGWFGPEKWRRAGAAAALAVGLPFLALWTGYGQGRVSYFIMRLRIALHPELDPLGTGYYACTLRRLLRDVPLAVQYGTEVPELHNEKAFIWRDLDFLPARIALETGWLVCLMVMGALLLLLFWLLVRCLRQKQQLGRLAALSVVLVLGVETLFSVAMNLGFVLFSSHLPLMMGNLHTMVDMALIGLALSVFRGRDVLRDEVPPEKRHPIFPWRIKVSIVPTKTD